MRAVLAVLLLCSSALASDARVLVAILEAEYTAKQTATPNLPTVNQQVEEAAAAAVRPKAVLITANFPCAPCEAWKKRIPEIPYDVEIRVQGNSPSGLFPYFIYEDSTSQTGWRHWSGTPDQFIRRAKK